ncbi:MAG: rhomboid family intramembrane serine protease, partial [Myxococcota bacterium]
AIGTNALSTLCNPSVSCGASGVVFGVWGAAAAFGIRYRELLPDRYRRYFIGNVIPYSIVTLYLGFVMPGVDNWGHLGGLIAGSLSAAFLPARLLEPSDRWIAPKIAGVSAVAFSLAALSSAAPEPSLSPQRLYSRLGLTAAIPTGWDERLSDSDGNSIVTAFGNEAEVGFGVRIERLERRVDPSTLVTWFTEDALEEELALADARGIRVVESGSARVDGVEARRVVTDMLTGHMAARAEHIVFARGHYRYVLSFSAPRRYADPYRPLFGRILSTVSLTEPRELDMARRDARQNPSPETILELANALARIGDHEEAIEVLEEGSARWPGARALTAAQTQLREPSGP